MKLRHIMGKGGGFLLALFFVFGITLASGTTAQAQRYPDNRDGRYRRDDNNRDGRRDRDRDRNRSSNVYDRNHNGVDDRYETGSVYDRNRNGVDDRYENNNVYDRNRNGVDDRYEQRGSYGNYGGYGNVNQAALNQGYQYGLNTGASDAQRRQSYDPQRSHYFKNASSQAFRQGFVQGYDQGYRQYGGNRGSYGRGYPTNRAGSILGTIFGRP